MVSVMGTGMQPAVEKLCMELPEPASYSDKTDICCIYIEKLVPQPATHTQ